jgi:hypothetical protein
MACVPGIVKSIISDCSTSGIGGNEVTAWIGNRTQLDFTYDVTNPSKITTIALNGEIASGERLWNITGVKKLLNSGYDRVQADDRPDKFTHYFNFQGFEFKAADVENMDNLDDVVVIVESKDKTDDGDGVFRAFGVKYGLYPSSDTMRANDINGARNIELTSLSGQEEGQSNYTVLATDYATTKALLVSLETPL